MLRGSLNLSEISHLIPSRLQSGLHLPQMCSNLKSFFSKFLQIVSPLEAFSRTPAHSGNSDYDSLTSGIIVPSTRSHG